MIRSQPHESVDINVTYRCNLGCNNCDRCCWLEHDFPDISLDAVREFTRQLPSHIVSIAVVGGEPTLHPQLHRIVDILLESRRRVVVFSNGIIPFIHGTVEVYGRKDPTKKQEIFFSHQNAPIDRCGNMKWDNPCYVADYCGPGFDFEGWFPCGNSAMISKIFNLNVAVKSFDMLTKEALSRQRNALCRYCGYYMRRWFGSIPDSGGEQIISKSWKEAIEKYLLRKGKLCDSGFQSSPSKPSMSHCCA